MKKILVFKELKENCKKCITHLFCFIMIAFLTCACAGGYKIQSSSIANKSGAGREFNISELVKFYILPKPGIYKAKATYKNKDELWISKGIYNETLTSDWLIFEVKDSDMVNAFGEKWQEVHQNYLNQKKEVEERAKLLEEKHNGKK